MPSLTDTILELSVASELRTQRFEADQRRRALLRLRKLERTLITRLAAIDPGGVRSMRAKRRRVEKLLKDVRKRITLSYGDLRKEFEKEYVEMVRVTAVEFNGKVNSSVSVLTESVAGKEAAARVGNVALFDKMIEPKRARQIVREASVMGGPMRRWWQNQAVGTQRRYINTITQGIEAKENFSSLRSRVAEAMQTSAREAEAMVQTSMQTIVNQTRRELYEMNADIVRGVEQRSILDRRTSLICIGLDGGRWTLDGRRMLGTVQAWPGYPPHHFRCRSTMMPIFKRLNEMRSVRGRAFRDQFQALPQEARSAIDTQIREGITIDEYLKKQPEKQLRQQLGSGKYDLWKAGKIDTTDLIDQRARPQTLAKLKSDLGIS